MTGLVRDKPESARITGAILGHTSPEIATRHYNQALMIDAGRRHAGVIEAMITDANASDATNAVKLGGGHKSS